MRPRTIGTGVTLLAMLALPSALVGQVTLGLDAGLTFSTLKGDDAEDVVGTTLETKTGFYVGGALSIPLGGRAGLGSGAYYVEKGANSKEGDGSVDLTYLEVPVVLQVNLTGEDASVGLGLFGGAAFGFNLSCDVVDRGESTDCMDPDVKSFDLGALFGGGINFPLSDNVALGVGGGVEIGLSTIADAGDEEDPDIKNRGFWFGAGLSFIVGG